MEVNCIMSGPSTAMYISGGTWYDILSDDFPI